MVGSLQKRFGLSHGNLSPIAQSFDSTCVRLWGGISVIPLLKLVLFFLLPVLCAQASSHLTKNPARNLNVAKLVNLTLIKDSFSHSLVSDFFPQLTAFLKITIKSDSSRSAAFRAIKEAADQGNAAGQLACGWCYSESIGVPADPSKAMKYFKLAADQGLPEAQTLYGVLQIGNDHPKEGAKYIRRAAHKKFAFGQIYYGLFLLGGINVTQNQEKGFGYCKGAARQGNIPGQTIVGICYLYGAGVAENRRKARRLFQSAAEAEYTTGQFMYALFLQRYGKSGDLPIILANFKAAANSGFAAAQASYAWMLENGQGVKKNRQKAGQYYKKAVEGGYEAAKPGLRRCARKR